MRKTVHKHKYIYTPKETSLRPTGDTYFLHVVDQSMANPPPIPFPPLLSTIHHSSCDKPFLRVSRSNVRTNTRHILSPGFFGEKINSTVDRFLPSNLTGGLKLTGAKRIVAKYIPDVATVQALWLIECSSRTIPSKQALQFACYTGYSRLYPYSKPCI